MQRAGRVLKSFGVKSYKLLLIIHFLTQHTLNLGFLFVFFLLQFKSRTYFLSRGLIKFLVTVPGKRGFSRSFVSLLRKPFKTENVARMPFPLYQECI